MSVVFLLNNAPSASTLTIGVPNDLSSAFWVETLGPTLDKLRKALPQHKIVTKEFSPAQLVSPIERLGIDFFVGSPFIFWESVFDEGASALAMRKPSISNNPGFSTAAVVVVPKNSKAKTLAEALRNKTLAIASVSASDEWTALKTHLLTHDIDLEKDKIRIREVGERTPGVVTSLLSGVADVGLLGFCELEKLERFGIVESGELRVIEPTKEGPFLCSRTSVLYPGFIFGVLSHVDSKTATEVAAALFGIKYLPSGDHWERPGSFSAVDKASRVLGTGPYAYLREWSFSAIWKRYSYAILLAVAILLLLLLHTVRANYLVKVRTKNLKQAMEENKSLAIKARENSRRIGELEKISTINHLSSVLAHELKQPVGTISNFVLGLELSINQQKRIDEGEVRFVLNKIKTQTEKISQLVGFVRKFAKQGEKSLYDFRECNLNQVVKHAIDSVKLNVSPHLSIELKQTEELRSYADAFGLELVVFNLLKNACEAVKETKDGVVIVEMSNSEQYNYIRIEDNGTKLSKEKFLLLSAPFHSIKESGLGLGIMIARNILEKFEGNLTFHQKEKDGLIAIIRLPRIIDDRKTHN